MNPQLDKCKNGHFKTEFTIYLHPKTGVRSCRLCRKDGQKVLYQRDKIQYQKLFERVAMKN